MCKKIFAGLVCLSVMLLWGMSTLAWAHSGAFAGRGGRPPRAFVHHTGGRFHGSFVQHGGVRFHAHVFVPFPPAVIVSPPAVFLPPVAVYPAPPPPVYAPPPPPVVYAPTRPVGTAILQIVVAPLQAEIYLNGRYIGRAEEYRDAVVQLSISPGQHVVELRYGTISHTHTIQAEAGTTSVVQDRLSSVGAAGGGRAPPHDPPPLGSHRSSAPHCPRRAIAASY
jgi:hypothetical protein